jgi:hypothetical protein
MMMTTRSLVTVLWTVGALGTLFLCTTRSITSSDVDIAAAAGGDQDGDARLMKLILLSQSGANDGQACLDGSPQAVYFRAGTGDGANKWVVSNRSRKKHKQISTPRISVGWGENVPL